MTTRILTKHPQGKTGVNIETEKYETMKKAIVTALKSSGETSLQDLRKKTEKALSGKFEGSLGWYFTVVKLDLEAREIVEVVKKTSPQKVKLGKL